MSKSIIATTYDLLTFHKSGNDSLFDRCFEKVIHYLGVRLDEQQRKKYRNIAFHYLRTTGYIDVVRSESKWALSPTALVQYKEGAFVLVGGSAEQELLRSVAPKDHIHQCFSSDKNSDFPAGVTLFPNHLELRTTATEAKRIATKIGVQFSPDYQDMLFRHMPSLQSVLATTLVVIDTQQPIFDPNSTNHFSLKDKGWKPYAEMQPHSPGLFRSDLRYAAPRYYLATENSDGGLDVFYIQDQEWALICFHAKLNIKLPLRYSMPDEKLSISWGNFEELRSPTLLERCFRSGTLDNPIVAPGWFTYSNMLCANLWQLMAKLPVFALELL